MTRPGATRATAERHDLIVCSLEPWDDVWRRNQFLVAGLMETDPSLHVLFVAPSCDPLHQLRRGQRPRAGEGLRPVPGVPRLASLQLTKWLPRVVGPVADTLLVRGLRRAAGRLAMRRPTLWINDPGWAPAVVATGWPSLYDITDDWVAADRSPREHDRIVRNERCLMQRCAAVVVCSTGLVATKSVVRPVELIPNAVDVERFRRPRPRPVDLPQRCALYVGTLHEDRLDVELCLRLGEELARRGGRLVFVGPVALGEGNAERLRTHPGIAVLGPRPNADVPAYLQHADVLVVPHLVSEFTDSLDPIKLYEYEAVGRPIAATPVAGFRELAGTPGVVISPAEGFAADVAHLLDGPSQAVGPFDVPDWAQRVAAMSAVLGEIRASD